MKDESTSYRFFPTVRAGYRPNRTFSKQFDGSIADDDSKPGEASVTLDVKAKGENGTTTRQTGVDLSIYGPGEVTNIDTDQVIRMEPEPETTDFPPNYFPLVEFDSPQLPWLFSPERADSHGRNRPWLCLVTVPNEQLTYKPAGTGPLPVVETAADQLPDLNEAWAWAHAQYVGSGDPESAFASNSEATVSRLLCPRNLDAQTKYRACVVPTFEPGRRAGLGVDPYPEDGSTISLAWSDEKRIRLPVYHSWVFTTARKGDFEVLARELEPAQLSGDIGFKSVDVSNPGPTALKLPADAANGVGTVDVGGALCAVGGDPDSYDDAMQSTLRDLLNDPLDVVETTDYGAVGPPLYGQWHAGVSRLEAPPENGDGSYYPTWFHTLNADLRNRIVAGYGTQVIREEQDRLMASAWEQFGEIQQANEVLNRFQLSEQILTPRHEELSTLSTGSLLSMSNPAHASAVDAESTKTVQGLEADGDLPTALTSTSFRRLTRPNGPIARRPNTSIDQTNLTTRIETGRLPQVTDGLDVTTEQSLGRTSTGSSTSTGSGSVSDSPPMSDGGDFGPNTGTGLQGDVVDPGKPGELPEFATGADLPGQSTTENQPETGGSGRGDTGAGGQAGTGSGDTVPSRSGADQSPDVAQALTALDSLDEHTATAHRAVSDLSAAVQSGDVATVEELVGTAPTVLDHCQSIRRNTFDPLTRALGKVLADPQPASLSTSFDRQAANSHLQDLHAAQRQLEGSVEAAVRGFQTNERPMDIKRRLDSTRQAVEEIERISDALRSALTPSSMTALSMTMSEGAGTGPRTGPAIGQSAPAATAVPPRQQQRTAVLGALDPQGWLPEFAAERTGIPNLTRREDPVQEVMAAPSFAEPAYKLLANLDREHFLPGAGDVPRNSVGVLRTNPQFIESFMAGLNHEFARELQWRNFPTDRRGTYFRRFWDNRSNPKLDASNPEQMADIEPMHTWDRNDLGENSPGADRTQVVLLVRGELLRRYPNTDIFMAKAVKDDGDRVPALPDTHVSSDKSEDVKFHTFRGTLDPDITFFGFDISPDQALYDPYHESNRPEPNDNADEGWFFVLQEPPAETRFGMDQGTKDDVGETPSGISAGGSGNSGQGSGTAAESDGSGSGWSELSWAHLVGTDGPEPGEVTYVDVDESRPGTENWTGAEPEGTTWGYNSAHMARATWQQPVRVSIHADDMMPEEPPTDTDWRNVQIDTPVVPTAVNLPEGSQ